MVFCDRSEAGVKLAALLKGYRGEPNTIVLAMPRGGLPVAFEIAKSLKLPLDLLLVKKVGAPANEEIALAAVSVGDTIYKNLDIINTCDISEQELNRRIDKAKLEVKQRNQKYRNNAPEPYVKGQHIILVDDGVATGASIKAGVAYLKTMGAAKITVAVPVVPEDTLDEIKAVCDQVVYLDIPAYFSGVGQSYQDFHQLADEEVINLLKESEKYKQTNPSK